MEIDLHNSEVKLNNYIEYIERYSNEYKLDYFYAIYLEYFALKRYYQNIQKYIKNTVVIQVDEFKREFKNSLKLVGDEIKTIQKQSINYNDSRSLLFASKIKEVYIRMIKQCIQKYKIILPNFNDISSYSDDEENNVVLNSFKNDIRYVKNILAKQEDEENKNLKEALINKKIIYENKEVADRNTYELLSSKIIYIIDKLHHEINENERFLTKYLKRNFNEIIYQSNLIKEQKRLNKIENEIQHTMKSVNEKNI